MRTSRDRGIGVVGLAVIAVVVLAVLSVTLIAAAASRRSTLGSIVYRRTPCTVPHLSGTTVAVTVSDRGNAMMRGGPMMATLRANPSAVTAGRVSFVVENRGALPHELVVLTLPAGGPGTRPTGTDGRIDEAQSSGEASASCAEGTGDGIAPGSTSWVTITLPPGRYELVCNEPLHYAAGMFDVLTVT
jgi:uncharacterized cupredoxin-like copper-binding protein